MACSGSLRLAAQGALLALTAASGIKPFIDPKDQGKLFADAVDTTCIPASGQCTGDDKSIPFIRGVCVGPQTGCAGSFCKCKDVCAVGNSHEPQDYLDPSYGPIESDIVEKLVSAVREGGANGLENLECPSATLAMTDAVTCGANNEVGQDCEFDGGRGICAENSTSSQVRCLDMCDYSLEIADYVIGTPEGTRSKIEYVRGHYCAGPWYVSVLKALIAICIFALLAICIIRLHFEFNVKRSRKNRSFENQESNEFNLQIEAAVAPTYSAPSPHTPSPSRPSRPDYPPLASQPLSLPPRGVSYDGPPRGVSYDGWASAGPPRGVSYDGPPPGHHHGTSLSARLGSSSHGTSSPPLQRSVPHGVVHAAGGANAFASNGSYVPSPGYNYAMLPTLSRG